MIPVMVCSEKIRWTVQLDKSFLAALFASLDSANHTSKAQGRAVLHQESGSPSASDQVVNTRPPVAEARIM